MSGEARVSRIGLLMLLLQALSTIIALFVVTNLVVALAGLGAMALALATFSGMLTAVLVATVWLRRDGLAWRDLGLGRLSAGDLRRALFTALALIAFYAVFLRLADWAGMPPLDISPITAAVADRESWLVWMILIGWGSAAFGEEMIWRGFFINRLERSTFLARMPANAVIAIQAVVFGLAHFYQGPTGILLSGVAGAILGTIYVRSGYRLWTVILAHGLVDSVALSLAHFGHASLLFGG